jgi:hypothetical protein
MKRFAKLLLSRTAGGGLCALLMILQVGCLPLVALNDDSGEELELGFLALIASAGGGASPTIGRIDVSGAQAVLVADRSLLAAAQHAGLNNLNLASGVTASGQIFAKALADGTFAEVVISDKNGVPIPGALLPTAIYDATPAYLIIVFSGSTYLVRKSDGAAFDLTPIGAPRELFTDSGGSGTTRKSIYADSSGSIYFLTSGRVRKIDVSNPDALTAQSVTPDSDSVTEFAVDLDGHVIYRAFGVKRIRKSNGGLYNLPNNQYAFWIGNDGVIYDVQTDGIRKILIDGAMNVTTPLHSGLAPTTYQGYQYAYMYMSQRILAICDLSYEFENPAQIPRQINFPFLAFGNRKLVKGGNQYWFAATQQGALIRVNAANDAVTTLIPDGTYDYFKMEASREDVLIFNALRLFDGKKVVGRVSAAGVVTVVLEGLEDDIVILQRVD